MSSVLPRVISGLKWTAVSQGGKLIAQFAGIFILARLLPPSDFGLIAMATVATGFANLFRDFGTAAAIIQRTDPPPQLLDSVFWLNVAFGTGLAVLLGLFAPVISFAFAEPRLKEVLWVLLLAFPILGLGAVHQALLEKASCFRPLALIETTAAFIGLASAVWAAWAGWGVYSLVLQTLLTALITTASLWGVSNWRPVLRWDIGELRGVLGFSGNLVGFNIFNYFIRNADSLLIGRFLGATDLGYYSMAYKLMLFPLHNISSVVGRALFPVFSIIQEDKSRLAGAYTRATMAIAFITAPLMMGFFVLREPTIAVALDTRWQPVADVLLWLLPVGLMQSIGATVVGLYLATGRTDIMFKWGIGAGLFVIPAFAIGLPWGITGVAAAYAIAYFIIFYPGLAIPYRLVGLKVGDILWRLMPSVATALVMAAVVAGLNMAWVGNAGNYMLRFGILIGIGILTYIGLSLVTQPILLKDIVASINASK